MATQLRVQCSQSVSCHQKILAPRAAFGTTRPTLPVRKFSAARCERQNLRVRAAAEEKVDEVAIGNSAQAAADTANWVPVCLPEELPKGVRKEVEVDGREVLLFWYRNQIYCIQSRSPAEGAYSEGFIRAKFTQDYCIECPSTGSLFSLKDGSIIDWYPNNAVLKALTPRDQCKPMEIYPVKLAQEAIYVDVTQGSSVKRDRGGAGTSLENNNVFTVQPTVYFEGMDPRYEEASLYQTSPDADKPNPVVALTATVALGIIAVAGTATAIYYENVVALAGFWVVLGGIAAAAGFAYTQKNAQQ